MFDVQPGRATLIAGRSLRLTSLWRVTRTDGVVLRFAAHDVAVPFFEDDFLEYVYSPVEAPLATAREMPGALSDVNLEVDGATSSTFTSDALRKGLFRGAQVDEYVVDWRYPWAGAITHHVYAIESLRFNGEDWRAEMSGIARKLDRRTGRRHSRRCDYDVGDAKCGVVLTGFTYTDTVISTGSLTRQQFVLSGSPPAGLGDDFFQEGSVTWLTGDNAGTVQEVQASTDNGGGTYVITLYLPTPDDIQTGDTFTIVAGCDGTYTVCEQRFGNGIDFGGFPTMPGSDKALQGP